MKSLRSLFVNTLVAIFLCALPFFSIGQATLNYGGNQNDTWYELYQSYYDNRWGQDTLEGGLDNSIRRMHKIWGPRSYPSGDLRLAQLALWDYANSFSPNQSSTFGWNNISPSEVPDIGHDAKGMGQIHRIVFSPNYLTDQTVYACSSNGGLWKSSNKGEDWTKVELTGVPIESCSGIAINPANTCQIIISTGTADDGMVEVLGTNVGIANPSWTIGMYSSQNAGNSWSPSNSGLQSFFQNNGNIRYTTTIGNEVWIATSSGIFASQNAFGASSSVAWSLVFDGTIPGVSNVENQFRKIISPPDVGNTSEVYVSGKKVYKFDGVSWQIIGDDSDFAPDSDKEILRINIDISEADPNKLWAVVKYSDIDTIPTYNSGAWDTIVGPKLKTRLFSLNLGSSQISWSQSRQINGGVVGWLGIAAHPTNANKAYFTDLGIYDEFEDGEYCCELSWYADGHQLVFEPAGSLPRRLFAANHAGVQIASSPFIDQFQTKIRGMKSGLIWSMDVSPTGDEIALGKQDMFAWIYSHTEESSGGSQRLLKPEKSWARWDALGDSYYINFEPMLGKHLFSTNQFGQGLYRKKYDYDLKEYQTLQNLDEKFRPNRPFNPANTNKERLTIHDMVYNSNNGSIIMAFNNLYRLKKPGYVTNDSISDIWNIYTDLHDNDVLNAPSIPEGKKIRKLWQRSISEIAICEKDPSIVYFAVGGHFEDGSAKTIPRFFRLLTPSDQPVSDTAITSGDIGWASTNYDGGKQGNGIWNYQVEEDLGCDLPITGIAVNPDNGEEVWVSVSGYDTGYKIRHRTHANGSYDWDEEPGSNTLPELPINAIIYVPSQSNPGMLYIGTDVGVFSKVVGTTIWAKHQDFPNVRVTELEYSYCNGYLYASTYGRGLWSTFIGVESGTYITISQPGTTLWAVPQHPKGDIVIEPGATLEITSDVFMPMKSRIIVEPGGTLLVNGGRVTNRCENMWRGIEVRGNRNQNQISGTQGQCIIQNGATLSGMEHGIVNHGFDSNFQVMWQSMGGTIQAKNSTFLNNKRDIGFQSYENIFNGNEIPNFSIIRGCTFTVDKYFLGDYKPHFVAVFKNNGLRIRGNRFEDLRWDETKPSVNQLVGINVIRGTIHVEPYCANPISCSPVPNRFEGVSKGIKVYGDPDNCAFYNKIIGNEFERNYGAIYLGATSFSEVHSNLIEIVETTTLTAVPYGIYFEGCNNYLIEGNEIARIDYSGGQVGVPEWDEACVGIIHNNSADANESVYLNQLKGLFVGTESIGQNRNVPGNFGLQYQCNDFEYSRTDIYVTDFTGMAGSNNPGIKRDQGDQSDGPGNRFSYRQGEYSSARLYEDLQVAGAPTHNYFHYSSQNMSSDGFEPGYYDVDDVIGFVVSANGQFFLNGIDCQPTIEGSGSHTEGPSGGTTLSTFIGNQQTAMASAQFQKLIYENTLSQLEDGGNTPLLESEVDQVTLSNSYNLYATLLAESPYISQEVLEELIGKENEFPEALLRDILVLNSQSLKENGTLEALDGRITALPDYMMDQVMTAAESGITAKELLENTISSYEADYRKAFRRAYKAMVSDTTGSFGVDSAKALLLSYNDFTSKVILADMAIEQGNTSDLNSILSDFAGDERNEKAARLIDYYNVRSGYATDSSLRNISSQDYETLVDLSEYHGVAAAKARSLLIAIDGEDFEYEEPVLLPGVPAPKSLRIEEDVESMKVFPNPARDFTVIYYRITPTKEADYALLITDLAGRIVYSRDLKYSEDQVVVGTNAMASGTYIAVVKSSGAVTHTVKFIVQK